MDPLRVEDVMAMPTTGKPPLDRPKVVLDAQPDPPSQPETPSPGAVPYNRLAPFVAGFTRAINTLQGGVPATWTNVEGAAHTLAEGIPRITVARLIAFCKERGESLEVMAARVLTDMLAVEPGLLELDPAEAAVDGAALMQSMWPQGAFLARRLPSVIQSEKAVTHPVLDKLRDLSAKWHRIAQLPTEQAKAKGPTAWRRKILNDIALAKAEGLKVGLTRTQLMDALESSGDRWVWEIPPPARDFFLDEFGQSPEGEEVAVSAIQS